MLVEKHRKVLKVRFDLYMAELVFGVAHKRNKLRDCFGL